jgi:CheY-like chemotaxis protein
VGLVPCGHTRDGGCVHEKAADAPANQVGRRLTTTATPDEHRAAIRPFHRAGLVSLYPGAEIPVENPKRILFVEDDVLIARIYRPRLEAAGFKVTVAEDGLAAMKLLPEFKADLVVLDLIMPKLNGEDVLRFIRGNAELKSTPVVVFSNGFLQKQWEQTAALGVQAMMLKSAATPLKLIETISKVLTDPAAASPDRTAPPPEPAARKPEPVREPAGTSGFRDRVRRDFFEQIPAICKSLDRACRDFLDAPQGSPQLLRLDELQRKAGFLTHMMGMAGGYRIAQLSSAFEALLYELKFNPASFTSSVRHTIASTVALLVAALAHASQPDEQCLSPTEVLVVDDDLVSSRSLALTLTRANLNPTTVPDPFKALEKLRRNAYDIALLDINLPGMTGITLCEEMRKLPLHGKTPVIFVTSYSEFEPCARAILKQGDDLIGKPIVPVELTVKIIAQLLKNRMKIEAPAA